MEIIKSLKKIPELSSSADTLQTVCDRFAFRVNTYYLSLIEWDNPNDPIRKIVIPSENELSNNNNLDISNEKEYTVTQGCEHKYPDTALLLVSNTCGCLCRFCFRKRIFMDNNKEVNFSISKGLEYIQNHNKISNILLTGGDPLMLSMTKLKTIINEINKINHVKIIRIGTKMPAFFPQKIDSNILDTLSNSKKQIYIMTHFNHPNEMTELSLSAIKRLRKTGAVLFNQTPLLNGINSNPEVLSNLMNNLSYNGITPYYIFINRPVSGNKMFSLPIEKGLKIFKEAKKQCSGLAKKAKLVMSHSSGKIEIAGLDENYIYFKYHRHSDITKIGEFFKRERNQKAFWFDEFKGE